jgi:hypothetical protein
MATLEYRLNAFAVSVRNKINSVLLRCLPAGGAKGQVLAKTDTTDYNAGWVTPSPAYMGSITIGETQVLTGGPRVISKTLAGVKAGDVLLFIPTACPDAYVTGQARCDADGTVKVWITVPAITLLTTYSITGRVYKLS